MTNAWILPLETQGASLGTAGGKGANLARLANAGFSVPPGFLLLTSAYRAYVAHNDLDPLIESTLENLDAQEPAALEAASAAIRERFAAGTLPPELDQALREGYAALGAPPVAVRSSATAEDLPELSFAGQQDTILNVTGEKALLKAVVDCWSSLWTARAIGYRARSGIAARGPGAGGGGAGDGARRGRRGAVHGGPAQRQAHRDGPRGDAGPGRSPRLGAGRARPLPDRCCQRTHPGESAGRQGPLGPRAARRRHGHAGRGCRRSPGAARRRHHRAGPPGTAGGPAVWRAAGCGVGLGRRADLAVAVAAHHLPLSRTGGHGSRALAGALFLWRGPGLAGAHDARWARMPSAPCLPGRVGFLASISPQRPSP